MMEIKRKKQTNKAQVVTDYSVHHKLLSYLALSIVLFFFFLSFVGSDGGFKQVRQAVRDKQYMTTRI